MISLESLAVGYGRRIVLGGLDLRFEQGSFCGLAGPNGCGKTTLLRTLSGFLCPIRGCVRLDGEPLEQLSARRRAQRIAVLAQDFAVEWPYTAGELTAMGRSPYLPTFGGLTSHDRDRVAAAMERAGITHLRDRRITELSGGERQRVRLAICLAQEPDVLLLDEPTSHLDPGHQMRMLDRIDRWRRENGITVIAVFHDLNLVAEYCDRVVLLVDGGVAASGTAAEVFTEQRIASVYGVRAHRHPNPVSGRPGLFFCAGEHDEK